LANAEDRIWTKTPVSPGREGERDVDAEEQIGQDEAPSDKQQISEQT